VVIAAQNGSDRSPNREYLNRWQDDEFELLFSNDTLYEYIQKLVEHGIEDGLIKKFIIALLEVGCYTEIKFYHFKKYSPDPDDIAFLLCAENGNATHLISYDKELLDLNSFYDFKICRPLDFLFELREILQS